MPQTAWTRRVLVGLLMTTPFLAHYASKGMVALLIGGAVLVSIDPVARHALGDVNRRRVVLVFSPLIVWGGLTALWAIEPGHSFLLALRLAATLAAALMVLAAIDTRPEADQRLLARVGAAAGAGLLILVGVDVVSDLAVMTWLKDLKRGPGSNDYINFINPGIALLALMAWSFAFCIHQTVGRWAALLFFGLAALTVWRGPAAMPFLGMAAGMIGFAVTLLAGQWGPRLVAWCYAVGVVVMPALVGFALVPRLAELRLHVKSWSLLHRFEIWNFSFARFLEKPLFGWGLDSSREIPGGRRSLPSTFEAELMPLHPHNSALQVWLELGFLGVAAYVLVLLFVGRRIERLADDRIAMAFATATLAAFAVQSQLSFGTWQNWWLASAALTVGLYRVAERARHARSSTTS